jgi:hypothetical protein
MTENKDVRNEILKSIEIHLKPQGFRKKSNSLIRETDIGLTQVINLTLGQSHSIFSNHLAIGFGIYTNEWHEHFGFGQKSKNISQSDCELRSEFNEFIPHDNNFCWIDLKQDLNKVQDKSQLLIENYFIPILDNLTTREKIIEQWNIKGNAIGLPPRGRLSVAILYWYLNNKEKATELINQELLENKRKPYYDFVIEKKNELNKNEP